MTFEEFVVFYEEGRRLRDLYAPKMHPWFDATSRRWPPIIGFGLPREGQQVPVATLALNPSDGELTKHKIPDVDDPTRQWTAQRDYFANPLPWFRSSDVVLNAALGHGHLGRVPHLDVTPLATSSKFDGTYDKAASKPEQSVARAFLAESMAKILFPLLALLQAHHGLDAVIMYGFVPARTKSPQRGSATLKDVMGGPPAVTCCSKSDEKGPFSVALGALNDSHPAVKAHADLSKLRFVFLARGPSGEFNTDRLQQAGRRVRELGWLAT